VSGNEDWFRFTTDGTAGSGAEVRIDFLHSLGDVDMVLYDANNNWLDSSMSVSDNESISLAGLDAGTYYVRVWGWNGASNPNYSLTIDPRVRGDVSSINPDYYDQNYENSSWDNAVQINSSGVIPHQLSIHESG
ncbi:PPC domain-containing protein, partial [Limnospira indica]|uniref:PPC domain-containing protein n=1 Tax=Limnospira indica TaxID=147322 RepID=UPI0023573127